MGRSLLEQPLPARRSAATRGPFGRRVEPAFDLPLQVVSGRAVVQRVERAPVHGVHAGECVDPVRGPGGEPGRCADSPRAVLSDRDAGHVLDDGERLTEDRCVLAESDRRGTRASPASALSIRYSRRTPFAALADSAASGGRRITKRPRLRRGVVRWRCRRRAARPACAQAECLLNPACQIRPCALTALINPPSVGITAAGHVGGAGDPPDDVADLAFGAGAAHRNPLYEQFSRPVGDRRRHLRFDPTRDDEIHADARFASSIASTCVRPASPAFEAPYGLSPGNPRKPTTAPMLTIEPPAPMCGSTARAQCSAPDRFTASTACQSSSDSLSTLPPRCSPALLTRTSIPPQASANLLHRADRSRDRNVRGNRQRRAAQRLRIACARGRAR